MVTRKRLNITYIVCLVAKCDAANMFVKRDGLSWLAASASLSAALYYERSVYRQC